MEPITRRRKRLGPLHDLLLRACPANEKGTRSIYVLAAALGIKPQAIQLWIKNGRIPPRRAADIVDLSEGRVTLGDFSSFIYL